MSPLWPSPGAVSSCQHWDMDLDLVPTFLGENTPKVPPSSLMATPISASNASLEEQSWDQYKFQEVHRSGLSPI